VRERECERSIYVSEKQAWKRYIRARDACVREMHVRERYMCEK